MFCGSIGPGFSVFKFVSKKGGRLVRTRRVQKRGLWFCAYAHAIQRVCWGIAQRHCGSSLSIKYCQQRALPYLAPRLLGITAGFIVPTITFTPAAIKRFCTQRWPKAYALCVCLMMWHKIQVFLNPQVLVQIPEAELHLVASPNNSFFFFCGVFCYAV